MVNVPTKRSSMPMNRIADPLLVGGVKLRNRVFLAPMSGVTDLPFRRRAHAHGAGIVVSEMIASAEYCRARRESRVRADASQLPIRMLQLAGRETRWMAEAARIAEGEGADIIDINMGCPAKKVTGGLAGSALMREPDHALALIEATVNAVGVPVTLKMRLGWDETSINAPDIARRAVSAGVQMITVHGRTRMQQYKGNADWARIAAVREAVSVPLVVNGDVATIADIDRATALSGADAVMIGRACYGRPWLPGALAQEAGSAVGCITSVPRPEELGGYVAAHYEDMLSHYGRDAGIRHARKHLGWYFDRHTAPGSVVAELRRRIMTLTDPGEVTRLLHEALSLSTVPATLPARAA